MTTNPSVQEPDFLDEDSVISNQKFFVLSYILPKNSNDQPLFKVRGSFSCVEDCEKRIKRLQSQDRYFNMYIAEVGKWGSLLTADQLKAEDIESIYNNKQMNDIVRGHKENKDKIDLEHKERTDEMIQKAREEGSKEGQEALANRPQNPMVVKIRLQGLDEQISKLKKELEELNVSREKDLALWNSFDEKDVIEAEKEFEEYKKTLKG